MDERKFIAFVGVTYLPQQFFLRHKEDNLLLRKKLQVTLATTLWTSYANSAALNDFSSNDRASWTSDELFSSKD